MISTLKTFLQLSGFEVEVAQNGEQALEKLEWLRPDLVVLDVLMPHLDGRESCGACAGVATGLRLSCSRKSVVEPSALWRLKRARTTT